MKTLLSGAIALTLALLAAGCCGQVSQAAGGFANAEPQTLAVGGAHNCRINRQGRAQCWGYNYFGQLGVGSTAAVGDEPGEMGGNMAEVNWGPQRATSIAAGENHTCAILDNDAVICWGYNGRGQLGRSDPANVGDRPGFSVAPVPLGETPIVALALGTKHSCALHNDGAVACWGANSSGQLGASPSDRSNPHPMRVQLAGRATAIAAGGLHTCAILEGGRLQCWGDNTLGQLGLGDTLPHPLSEGAESTASEGKSRKVLKVSAATYTTCALFAEGQNGERSVRCWGDNRHGELGTGDNNPRGASAAMRAEQLPAIAFRVGEVPEEISIGWDHACTVLRGGSVRCWGATAEGQAGTDLPGSQVARDEQQVRTPVAVQVGAVVLRIQAGTSHTCVTLLNGQVRCWGANSAGQLGQGHVRSVGTNQDDMGLNLRSAELAP
jgi:alpha-tubulin suppressor-like RCC1 family protein